MIPFFTFFSFIWRWNSCAGLPSTWNLLTHRTWKIFHSNRKLYKSCLTWFDARENDALACSDEERTIGKQWKVGPESFFKVLLMLRSMLTMGSRWKCGEHFKKRGLSASLLTSDVLTLAFFQFDVWTLYFLGCFCGPAFKTHIFRPHATRGHVFLAIFMSNWPFLGI